MARKRVIDPKFWTDDKVMELSYAGRCLFIGIWNYADDEGIHINNSKVLKAEIFPGDDITLDEINELKAQLIKVGMIQLNNDNSLFKIKNWSIYQKISHPQPSKYSFITEEKLNDSLDIPKVFSEDSENTQRTFTRNIIESNIIESNTIKDNIKDEPKVVSKVKKPSKPKPYTDKVNEFFKSIDDEYKILLKESFPNVNIEQELKSARAWLLSNTHKAKGRFKAFVTRWMTKAMERPQFNNTPNVSDEVLEREKIKRIKYEQKAEENAASKEEYQAILKDTVEKLRMNKRERVQSVTNI